MIKKILHIIYNERRENSWLVVEIIAASIMLWVAFDPLFTLVRLDSIDDGYNLDGTYLVSFTSYQPYDNRYSRDNVDTERSGESYFNLYNVVRNLPEVESYCLTGYNQYPGTNSVHISMSYFTESIDAYYDDHEKYLELVKEKGLAFNMHEIYNIEGYDYFTTFRVKDAFTGEIFTPRKNDTENNIYISEKLAELHYGGTSEAIGKKMYSRDICYTISGVFKDMQIMDYADQGPIMIKRNDGRPTQYRNIPIHIRLKKGVDQEAFVKRFKAEVMPLLKAGNVYCTGIESHKAKRERQNESRGVPGRITMYTSMALFSLFAMFLGILSAFWIRTSSRKCEIGIMRSVGASKRTIIRQFITEATLLVNIGFAVAMLFVLHHLHVNGYTNPMDIVIKPDPSTLGGPLHFTWVTATTYIILLIIAIAGAAIPAWRITRILPADALKEE